MKRDAVFIICACLVVFLAGCGGQSYTYESETEQKPGPGLLSGADGVFTLIQEGEKDKAVPEE